MPTLGACAPRGDPRQRSGRARPAPPAWLIPRTRTPAGLGSAALLLAVYPGNIKMAIDAAKGGNKPMPAATFARLPLQFPMIRRRTTRPRPELLTAEPQGQRRGHHQCRREPGDQVPHAVLPIVRAFPGVTLMTHADVGGCLVLGRAAADPQVALRA